MTDPSYWELTCTACGQREVAGPLQMLERLRAAGMLKREKEPDWEVVRELFRTRSNVRRCAACGAATTMRPAETEEDVDWGDRRACERCRTLIPPERLELFPKATLCAACQQLCDRTPDQADPEFCPRCGEIMLIRLSRSSGIARYVLQCPGCRTTR